MILVWPLSSLYTSATLLTSLEGNGCCISGVEDVIFIKVKSDLFELLLYKLASYLPGNILSILANILC